MTTLTTPTSMFAKISGLLISRKVSFGKIELSKWAICGKQEKGIK
jgi:hypothetical protein